MKEEKVAQVSQEEEMSFQISFEERILFLTNEMKQLINGRKFSK